MSGSERIINLLGHYRDRLKRKGDYSEELDYLVGILESPFMREFLEGNMSREDTDHFNEVTSEVISALEEQEEEVHLSPETQRKLVLKRRQSLRALKLAVTPQSSPHITPRTSKISLTNNPLLQHQSSNDSPLLKSVMDTLSSRESSCEPSFSLLSPSPPPTEGATVHDEPSYHDNSVSERKESVASSVSSNTSQLTVLRGGATDEAPPTLPSYSEAFNMCRRTKSYERLPATPPYPAPLMTSGIPTSNTNTSQTRPKSVTMVTVRLTKGDRGLGFSLSSQRRGGKDNKIFIGDLQPGGVAERDGRIMKGDQILHINGQDITSISYSTVVALLQQAKGIVELTLLRSDGAVPSPIRTTPPNPYEAYYRRELYQPHPMTQPTTTNKVIPSKQSYQQYNQQQQEQGRVHRPSTTDYKHIVSLEVDQDLGFSIISKDGITFVHVITPGSTTEKDGKLMSGDQLLSVNGEEVFGLSHSSVLDILQSCKRFPDQPVKLVVSRQTGPGQVEEAEESFSDIDSSSSDTETVEVQLVKSTSGRGGLGISINALVNDHTEEDKGIYIRAVHPEGPAALSGSVHCKDRIVSVNSQSLRGLSNKEAARLLRTAGDSVRLELRRKKREKREGGGERAEGNVEDNRRTGQLEGTDGVKEEEEEEVVNESGLRVRSPLSPSVVQWGNILGPDKELITAYIQKTDDSKGLGFGMET
ncbi:PREDICTED: multiple PDZ domain protein-like [Amphimedon queenslandica]|uniref:PDZ domain-containing protein n=1 Tax=Amphimedon queenslandica TaxID=400682 RepID=A0AAN0JFG3_AMPQE|nr:PREDICTED: multiple PDZ domain protein-like [Amphimedon queenslandica]|eukprot:XP_019855527.1 PREDICTED: multiple PDZ domain protein-like [Amphimedon queenslandica]